MKISIAMATYNGAKYLQEQLDSFTSQALLPDELVICDDGSTDATLEIIEEFSAVASFSVIVFRNEKKLGYAENFGRAISQCSGDLIFLSDQDDVWFSNKLERVAQLFISEPSMWVVVNNAEITDTALNGTGLTVAGQVLSAGLPIEKLLLGCCIAFRSQLKALVMPIPLAIGGHDGWINTLGVTLQSRIFSPEILQYYRRHTTNTSEWLTTRTSRASRWKLFRQQISLGNLRSDPTVACDRRLAQLHALKDRLKAFTNYLEEALPSPNLLNQALAEIDSACIANERRKTLQSHRFGRRLSMALSFYRTGGYQNFEGFKSFAKDVLR
ncbi:MAG: glycosyltransferase family 2 protein [Halothiobacillus sp.]|jgi:hypothetical protein|nr:glycosyltransferase family 2 protein [Halothiobacillus sp.]